jgi:hypothetical protein
LLVAAVFVSGCDEVRGSGNIVTESRSVAGFTGVEMPGDGELHIEVTGTESLTITADDNLMQFLRSDRFGSRLILDRLSGVSIRPTRGVIYKLTVKNLDDIRVSGDGTIDAKGVSGDRLRVEIRGDGSVHVEGTVDEQVVRISGDGSYDGRDLDSKRVRVDVSGDGRVLVAVKEKLEANIRGDGSVEYLGNPAITQHISGDGSLRPR